VQRVQRNKEQLPTKEREYVSTDTTDRARVETGKSWRNESSTFRGLFRMALESRNETGN
jgi:hypothetical protein